jgi:glycosyltransferase involved in cell wall biosynthesis
MSRIRVLHIIKSLGRGGAEMLLPETLKLHDPNRFHFTYVYFLPWKDQLVKSIRDAGGEVYCFEATNNLGILLRTRQLIRWIRHQNIQLIHCHLPWAGLVGRIVHRLTKIPVIYTEHNVQERYHRITRLFNRITFNWQTEVIAVSKDVGASIDKNINLRVPVRVIANGVNTSHFMRDRERGLALRRELGIPLGAFIIGTIAVFRFQKRLLEWLELASAVTRQRHDVYFIMVGDGPLKEEIISRRRLLNLGDRVFMPGLQEDVIPWLSAIDIYLMTSKYEGLPVALLEAMSMGCAIITTDAGGVKDVIQDAVHGIMVPVERYIELQEHLLALCADGARLQSLAEAARKRVVQDFSLEAMVNQLESVYSLYDDRTEIRISND